MQHPPFDDFSSSGTLPVEVTPDTPQVHTCTYADDDPCSFKDIAQFLAFSRDLGTIQATRDPIVLAIGYTTDPAISYANQSASSQERRPYYKSQYSDDESMVTSSIFEQVLVLIFCFRLLTF